MKQLLLVTCFFMLGNWSFGQISAERLFENAELQMDTGNYAGAEKDFSKAIALKKHFPGAYNGRGEARLHLEKYEQAVKDLSRAIDYAPQYGDAIYNRSLAYEKLEKYEEAIKDMTRYIELEPQFVQAYSHRALLHSLLFQYTEAFADLEQAKAMAPNECQTWFIEGDVWYMKGNLKKACKAWEKAAKMGCEQAQRSAEEFCK